MLFFSCIFPSFCLHIDIDDSLMLLKGMVDADEKVSETLRREFSEEAFAKLDMPEQKRQTIMRKIDDLFKRGTEVTYQVV